jgi:pilus assembly protein CpaE
MMPDMDGYEVTRRLRADPATSSIPVIMFTAKSQVDDKVTGFEAGADDYLSKPTQPRELFAHVKAVLARGSKSRPAAAPVASAGGDKGHVVGVLGAKGGLGISSLVVNLGVSLRARIQREVIIAEYRPGMGSIALDLGYNRPEGMARLLQKKAKEITMEDVQTELMTHSDSGLRVLPSTYQPADGKYIAAAESFEAITGFLAYLGNYVLLDLGPGISPISERVLGQCDEVIIPVEPIPHTITRSRILIQELTERGFGEGRINVVLYNRNRSEFQLSLAQVQESLKFAISIVFTPTPELMYQASRNNTPLVLMHPDNLTAQQFYKLAEIITKHTRVKN